MKKNAMCGLLLAIVPFFMLTIYSAQISLTNSTETNYVPDNFCEYDLQKDGIIRNS